MNDEDLDFHFASLEERKESFRNMHEEWAWAASVEDDVNVRLASPQYRRARSCVGCLEGRVVVSLASYPMRYMVQGQPLGGIAIGAVFTVPEYRRRGYAARLIKWVERVERQGGASLSLLFSDIDPAYYARLGYSICPSWEIVGLSSSDANSSTGGSALLTRFDAASEIESLRKLHDDYHRSLRLAVARDDDYWTYLLRKGAEDEFYWLSAGEKEPMGYVRLGMHRGRLLVRDFALRDHDESLYSSLSEAVAHLLKARHVERLGGWLPSMSAFECSFELTQRRAEMSMVKALAPELDLTQPILEAVQYLHEIDHV